MPSSIPTSPRILSLLLAGGLLISVGPVCAEDPAPPRDASPAAPKASPAPGQPARPTEYQLLRSELLTRLDAACRTHPELEAVRTKNRELLRAALKAQGTHPALEGWRTRKRAAMANYADAVKNKDAAAAEKHRESLAKIEKELEAEVAKVPELQEAWKKSKAAEAEFLKVRDEVLGATPEGKQFLEKLQKAQPPKGPQLVPAAVPGS